MSDQESKFGPRITMQDIEENIASEYFFLASDGAFNSYLGSYPGCEKELSYLTFCVLVLRNGFTVTGESACVSPENFDAMIGRKVARENAVQKIWPLMGYELKERLSNTPPVAPPPADDDIPF